MPIHTYVGKASPGSAIFDVSGIARLGSALAPLKGLVTDVCAAATGKSGLHPSEVLGGGRTGPVRENLLPAFGEVGFRGSFVFGYVIPTLEDPAQAAPALLLNSEANGPMDQLMIPTADGVAMSQAQRLFFHGVMLVIGQSNGSAFEFRDTSVDDQWMMWGPTTLHYLLPTGSYGLPTAYQQAFRPVPFDASERPPFHGWAKFDRTP